VAGDLDGTLGGALRERQAGSRLPALAATLRRGSEVLWSEAIGLADVEAGTPASTDQQVRIGSITKTFTAVLLLQLRDEGRLSLDDRLGDHLPGTAHAELRLAHLLAHHSGLQREPPGDVWDSLELPDAGSLARDLHTAEAVLPPGRRWHYSNLGYALLGAVVEQLRGAAWADVLAERLLRPLGLARTSVTAQPPRANGYLVDAFSERALPEPDIDLRATAPAGQLWSTVDDLARWAAFLAEPDPGVLAQATADEMHELRVMADEKRWTLGWGLGLMLWRRGDRVFAGHGGAMPGFRAAVAHERESCLSLAFATNASTGVGESFAVDLLDLALGELPAARPVWTPAGEVPPELDGLLGRWWSEGEELVIARRDGRLEVRHAGAPPSAEALVLVPDGEDRYRVASGSEQGELLRVVRDGEGRVVELFLATYPVRRMQLTFGDLRVESY
jgi:CubicO group peptidase (beta-lactamase class C family)